MKVNPGYLLLSVFLLLFCQPQVAQDITDPQELFSEGEFFYLAEEYEEALYFYLQLVELFPDHANYNFKVGDTYLNIPGQEYKAIPYLEIAITNNSFKYKKRSFKEKKAPHFAYFSLGNAYRINNEIEKALDIYQVFTSSEDFEGNYNLKMVEDEVWACERSMMIQDVPVNVEFEKLGSPVNINSDNTNAVLSGDGNTMIFITELAFYDAIHLSKKVNGLWTEPEVLNPQVQSDGDMYPTSLSYDGRELFLVKRTEGNNDIYVSRLGTDFWSKAKALGPTINSGTDETHASISADGKTLFFTSARRGGFGGLDIYRSERLESGEWTMAENLGPVVNSIYDEDTPFLSDIGNRLYFSSSGHFNMGGYDVFYSNLDESGVWKDPINMGFPINTTTDDLFYYPIGIGNQGYISKIERQGAHAYNIYHLSIGERVTEFRDASDQTRFPDNFTIRLIHTERGDTIILQYLKDEDLFKTIDPSYKISIEDQ
ncbi:MAG TPA: hypothetical protein ENI20_04085 [Bacteroides sp.]|nr:hypothetical protein [Bacteroides sp.]